MNNHHPAIVPEWVNVELKRRIASQCDCYTIAFNNDTITDVDFSTNKTRDLSNVGYLLANSSKPVIFTICYYVRFDKDKNYQINHVVCCIKLGNTIYMCDMRNQCDLSPNLTIHIQKELERLSGLKLNIVNACFDGKNYIYLQRYKGKKFGYCIAWSLFFLEHFMRMKGQNIIPQLKQLYALINRHIEESKSNSMIEQYYETNLRDLM